jgi:hypothetical protein
VSWLEDGVYTMSYDAKVDTSYVLRVATQDPLAYTKTY